MNKARKLSYDVYRNTEMRCSHVSYLLCSGKVIATGYNRLAIKGSVHAEQDVIQTYLLMRQLKKNKCKIKREVRKLTLVVYRFGSNGCLRESKPCAICTDMIKSLGIKKIIYSTDKGTIIKTKMKNILTEYLTFFYRH